jgi:hypothetical protein
MNRKLPISSQQVVLDPKKIKYRCGCYVVPHDSTLKETADGVEMNISADGLCPEHGEPVLIKKGRKWKEVNA